MGSVNWRPMVMCQAMYTQPGNGRVVCGEGESGRQSGQESVCELGDELSHVELSEVTESFVSHPEKK